MKRLLFLPLACAFFSCSKDKFQTVPQVKITDFGPSEVVKGQIIRFEANVTDKEGDVQDSVVFCRKMYSLTDFVVRTDSIKLTLKDFGIPKISNQEYQLVFNLSYGEIKAGYELQNNGDGVDRKLTIGVYVKDKAGNRSTYVESDKILLKKI